jgi:hypothetical protein
MELQLISDLVSAELITEEESLKLQENLQTEDKEIQNKLWRRLFTLFYEKNTGNKIPTTGGFIFSANVRRPLNDDQKADIDLTQVQKLVEILRKNDFIQDKAYQKLSLLISNFQITDNLLLIYFADVLSSFYHQFTIEKQVQFAEQLSQGKIWNSMLPGTQKDKLIRDIKKGIPQNYLDFFKYCVGCKYIDATDVLSDLKKLLKLVVKEINKLMYEGPFIKEVKFTAEKNTNIFHYHNGIRTIAINTGDKWHTKRFTFTDVKSKANLLDVADFFEFLNSLLSQFNLGYRLVFLTLSHEMIFNTSQQAEFVICLVDHEMIKVFEFDNMRSKYLWCQPHMLRFQYHLSYQHIGYLVYHLKESGIIDHLSEEEIKQIEESLLDEDYPDLPSLCLRFPGSLIVAERNFITKEKPYYNFLKALQAVSKNVLRFDDIEDTFDLSLSQKDGVTCDLKFIIDGKIHALKLNGGSGGFDINLIYYLLEEIIRPNYGNYVLHNVISTQVELDYYIFAPKKIISYLHKHKVLNTFSRF